MLTRSTVGQRQADASDVAMHANDRDEAVVVRREHRPPALSERGLPRPEHPCRRSVDEGDVNGVGAITGVEIPTLQERNAQRTKDAG
jgi:hypothetical protein